MPGLGSLSDPVWENQETNAEMSDFVIYNHEFQDQTEWLNTDGEDHVKQIAARLQKGQEATVVIERTRMSPRAGTDYQYPVHANPKLDQRRRDLIATALSKMGVPDAEQRVVVAPAFAQGMRATEAEAGYRNAMQAGSTFGAQGGFGGFFFGGGTRF
jgi:hypothetical protein